MRRCPVHLFDPEIGSIGLTERAARERGLDLKVGKFPFSAVPRHGLWARPRAS